MGKKKRVERAINLDKTVEFTKDIKEGVIVEKTLDLLTGNEVWIVVDQIKVMFAENLSE